MLQAYLYIRMYYNKIRKTVHQWWQHYLLFKWCLAVIPIYSALIIIGLYCIMYDIDVNTSLKTVYQFFILILSAAVIFIFVLLLATFNGDSRPPDETDSNIDHFEVDLDSISLPRRRSFRSGGDRGRGSVSSSIWSAIFGNYNEDEDEEFDDDVYLNHEDMMALAAIQNAAREPISTFDDLPPLMMSQAQNRLVNSLEQATDGLEFFFDQCNSFELSPEDHMVTPPRLTLLPSSKRMQHQQQQHHLPPPYYEPSTSSMQYDYSRVTSTSILPEVGSPPPTFGGHLAPPMPPTYSCTNQNYSSPSTVVDISPLVPSTSTCGTVKSTSATRELPPSYEEAIRK